MTPSPHDNVVIRLKHQLRQAREMGFKVRMEMLDSEQPSWCEIAGVQTLFVDISQTAGEQLQQVEETLRAYLSSRSAAGVHHGPSHREPARAPREPVHHPGRRAA